jgi:hypothetical protein
MAGVTVVDKRIARIGIWAARHRIYCLHPRPPNSILQQPLQLACPFEPKFPSNAARLKHQLYKLGRLEFQALKFVLPATSCQSRPHTSSVWRCERPFPSLQPRSSVRGQPWGDFRSFARQVPVRLQRYLARLQDGSDHSKDMKHRSMAQLLGATPRLIGQFLKSAIWSSNQARSLGKTELSGN